MYLLLRGDLDIADRLTNGNPTKLQAMGESPQFEIMVEEQRAENYATSGALNEKDLSVPIVVEVKGALTQKEADGERLSIAVFGTVTEVEGATHTAQAFPSGIADGERHLLPGRPVGVSAVTIVDSAGTPATLVLNSDYSIDLDSGIVTFIDVSGFTQPFKATYTEGDSTHVAVATRVTPEKYLLFRGINLADNEKPVFAEFYRTRFGPAKKVSLKTPEGKEVAAFEYDLEFLADPTKPRDPVLGRYGRIRYPA